MKAPPAMKWLINEIAMLNGELERMDREMSELAARRADVEKTRNACQATLNLLVDRVANVSLEVQAHRPYGTRGNLGLYLAESLKQAYPDVLDTTELALGALMHFGLQFSSPTEWSRFRKNSVGRTLHRLHKEGLIERVSKINVGTIPGKWRWHVPALTLEALQEQATTSFAESLPTPEA